MDRDTDAQYNTVQPWKCLVHQIMNRKINNSFRTHNSCVKILTNAIFTQTHETGWAWTVSTVIRPIRLWIRHLIFDSLGTDLCICHHTKKIVGTTKGYFLRVKVKCGIKSTTYFNHVWRVIIYSNTSTPSWNKVKCLHSFIKHRGNFTIKQMKAKVKIFLYLNTTQESI
jgi:hypothetical protein